MPILAGRRPAAPGGPGCVVARQAGILAWQMLEWFQAESLGKRVRAPAWARTCGLAALVGPKTQAFYYRNSSYIEKINKG